MPPEIPYWPLVGLAFLTAFAIFLLFVGLAALLMRWLPFRDPRVILREVFGAAVPIDDFHRDSGGYTLAFHHGGRAVRLQRRRGDWLTTVGGQPMRDLTGGLGARLRRLRERLV